MTDLSPAALAILDAYGDFEAANTDAMAAALRAVADQVVPKRRKPMYADSWEEATWTAQQDTREELLAIAAELDNTSPPSK
jgi:hypothetical protein